MRVMRDNGSNFVETFKQTAATVISQEEDLDEVDDPFKSARQMLDEV